MTATTCCRTPSRFPTWAARQCLARVSVKRYVLGLAAVEAPRASRGEQWWFVGYALLSFVYRMFIMFLAIFLVAGSSFSASCWPAGPS